MHGIVTTMIHLMRCALFIALVAAFSCTKKESKAPEAPKDEWADFASRYCANTVDSRFQEAGYQPGEKPAIWKKSLEEAVPVLKKTCGEHLLAALNPCRIEYKYGSDSAIQCVDRYSNNFVAEWTQELQTIVPDKVPGPGKAIPSMLEQSLRASEEGANAAAAPQAAKVPRAGLRAKNSAYKDPFDN